MFSGGAMDREEKIILQMGQLLKSVDGDADIETDEDGNPIVYAPASTEAVDQDGQVVLQRALTGSVDYFKRNGVVSWDHQHLRPDPNDKNWSASKYIIGEPLDVVTRGRDTFVKAKLYKDNPIVQDIIGKLKNGAKIIKTSVGGLRPQIIQEYDKRLKKPVEKVVSVLWNELALTYKPVNDDLKSVGLTPAAFLKSLELGYSTDSATATGGGALVKQDLEGAKDSKSHFTALITAMSFGDVRNEKEARHLLKNRGCSDEDSTSIIRHLVDNKQLVKGVLSMEKTLEKSFDDSVEELRKAMGGKATQQQQTEPDDDDFGFEDGAEGGEGNEGNEGGQAEPDGDEGNQGGKGGKGMQKSIYDTIQAQEGDYLDVAPFLRTLTKSVSDAVESIRAEVAEIKTMQKSMGKLAVAQADLMKSMGNAPQARQSTLQKSERTFLGSNGQKQTMSRQEILTKSMDMVQAGKMSLVDYGVVEDRLNKGMPLSDDVLRKING